MTKLVINLFLVYARGVTKESDTKSRPIVLDRQLFLQNILSWVTFGKIILFHNHKANPFKC